MLKRKVKKKQFKKKVFFFFNFNFYDGHVKKRN